MPIIKNPVRAFRNAREAFRVWNRWRKERKAMKEPKLRTSTKAAGAMTAGTAVLVLVAEFYPPVNDLSPQAMLVLGGLINAGIGWLAARFSRTKSNPGVL